MMNPIHPPPSYDDFELFDWMGDCLEDGGAETETGASGGGSGSGADDPVLPAPAKQSKGEAGGPPSTFSFVGSVYPDGRVWGNGGGGGAGLPILPPPLPPPSSEPDGPGKAPVESDESPPGMVRSSSASFSSDDSEASFAMGDDASFASFASFRSPPPKGVTFNEQVRVLPIPPLSYYTPDQRRRMYADGEELRRNKLRNRREFEFDGRDWRNATEEGGMAVCPASGELLHPAHL